MLVFAPQPQPNHQSLGCFVLLDGGLILFPLIEI